MQTQFYWDNNGHYQLVELVEQLPGGVSKVRDVYTGAYHEAINDDLKTVPEPGVLDSVK